MRSQNKYRNVYLVPCYYFNTFNGISNFFMEFWLLSTFFWVQKIPLAFLYWPLAKFNACVPSDVILLWRHTCRTIWLLLWFWCHHEKYCEQMRCRAFGEILRSIISVSILNILTRLVRIYVICPFESKILLHISTSRNPLYTMIALEIISAHGVTYNENFTVLLGFLFFQVTSSFLNIWIWIRKSVVSHSVHIYV